MVTRSEPRLTPQQMLQCLTTEHYALQGAKSAIVAETNGRAALYLSSLSSAVVALAFIGNVSALSTAFFLFGIALFLPLFFLGITTFVRVYETATESMHAARRINRIRHFYASLAPELAPYLDHRTHDDMQDFFAEMAIYPPRFPPGRLWSFFEHLASIAGAIAVVNSMVAAVFVGFVSHSALGLPLWPTIGVATLAFAGTLALHVRHCERKYKESERHFATHFPNPPRTAGDKPARDD